jgi:hypothetical protein
MRICTHCFRFPVTDASIVFKQFMTLSICLEGTREDVESPGEADLSEGGEGELDVDMGRKKKRDHMTFKLAFIYMHITESRDQSGSTSICVVLVHQLLSWGGQARSAR